MLGIASWNKNEERIEIGWVWSNLLNWLDGDVCGVLVPLAKYSNFCFLIKL